MDVDWFERLTDERPGLSFLTEYFRALRISGLCNLGRIRARRRALDGRLDDQFRIHILSDPQVQAFLGFLAEFSADELPMVFEVMRQHLYPDAPSGCLFRAASLLKPTRSILWMLRTCQLRHLPFRGRHVYFFRALFLGSSVPPPSVPPLLRLGS